MTVSNAVAISGLVLEVVGVVMIANKFFNVSKRSLLLVLFSGLVGGSYFRKAVKNARAFPDDATAVLRGVCFIFWGFMFQVIGIIMPEWLCF